MIRGARVGPSPEWLKRRLETVGVRSINNVVDATNWVMLELNQPMHAYDAAKLHWGRLIVRRAITGERLVTLDGIERTLTDEMVAIADPEGVIGVAGVMGGASTEVSNETQDVLLEGAYWDPPRTRRTRRALGLPTEASYRFERGIDRWGGADAMRRCLEVVLGTAGGELMDAPVDLWPSPTNPPRIFLRPARVTQVLGVELPWTALEQHLVAIGATVVSKPEDGRIAVDVPGWRPDLQREVDLIEEIARIHGYDEFPSDLRHFRPGSLPDAPVEAVISSVRRGMVAQGLYEVVSLPLGPAHGDDSVRLVNPLSAEDSYLRRRLLPGLVRLVERNWANHVSDVRLFEIGTAFAAAPAGQRPVEERRLAAVMTGRREPPHWSARRASRWTCGISRAGWKPRSVWRFRVPRYRLKGTAGSSGIERDGLSVKRVLLAADAPPGRHRSTGSRWQSTLLHAGPPSSSPCPRRLRRSACSPFSCRRNRGGRGSSTSSERRAAIFSKRSWSRAIIGEPSCLRQREASLSGSPSGRRTVRCATPKWTRPSPDCSPPWRRSSGSGGEMRALTRGE